LQLLEEILALCCDRCYTIPMTKTAYPQPQSGHAAGIVFDEARQQSISF